MEMSVTREIFWIRQSTKASALFSEELFYKKEYLHAYNISIVEI